MRVSIPKSTPGQGPASVFTLWLCEDLPSVSLISNLLPVHQWLDSVGFSAQSHKAAVMMFGGCVFDLMGHFNSGLGFTALEISQLEMLLARCE